MTNQLFFRSAIILFAMLLAACAQSPQRINVQPTLSITGDASGNGRAIIVSAADQRTNKVLGSLGGVYGDSATITIGNDVEQALARTANALLATQGYVVNSSDPSALQLNIVLENLTYQAVEQQPVGRVAKLNATLRADIGKNGETFTGRYSSQAEHGMLARPDPEDNEKYVNDLLSETLTRMFSDNRLRDFLRK